jgi:hypothetical protein
MISQSAIPSSVTPIARAGLISKGVVYCLLGLLAFMAAFEIGGTSDKDASKKGVFDLIEGVGGKWLIGILALGLFCYTFWRVIQVFREARKSKGATKKSGKAIRYLFSAIVYFLLALYAARRFFGNGGKGGADSTQSTATELMSKPLGPWLVGLLGLALAITGVYQIFYGWSGKYRKHVQDMSLHSTASRNLLRAGKIGYVARGIVWLMLAWLLFRAAFESDSREAGDTSKAFHFLEGASFGSYLLGALGIGLVCFGVFNFVRARWERF